WSAPRRCSATPTGRSPTSACLWASRASARSRRASSASTEPPRRHTARPIRRPPTALACRRAWCVSSAVRNTAHLKKTPARTARSFLGMYRIANAQLWVHDQDEALAFYTEKLGMEVRSDVTLPELGDFRWLTVGPPGQEDFSIVLMAIPGEPVMDEQTAGEV